MANLKSLVYFQVGLELFRALTRRAKQTRRSRSELVAEAVRAYLAAPFPVRAYRLPAGTPARKVGVFLGSDEYERLRQLADEYGTDLEPVSLSALLRAATEQYLGLRPPEAEHAPPADGADVIETVPVPEDAPPPARRGRHRRPRRRRQP